MQHIKKYNDKWTWFGFFVRKILQVNWHPGSSIGSTLFGISLTWRIYHGWSMNTSWSWISLKLTARPWKWGTLGKGDSLWKPPFLGAILVLGSVIEGADSSTKPHLESDGEEPRSRLQDQSILCSWKCPVLPCYPIGDIWKLIMCKSCIFNIYVCIYNKIGETLATTAFSLWTKSTNFICQSSCHFEVISTTSMKFIKYLDLYPNQTRLFMHCSMIHCRVEAHKKKKLHQWCHGKGGKKCSS